RRVTGEARPDELLERLRVAVLGSPELSDLLQSAREPAPLPLPVLREELLFERGPRSGELRLLQLGGHSRTRKTDRKRKHNPRSPDTGSLHGSSGARSLMGSGLH